MTPEKLAASVRDMVSSYKPPLTTATLLGRRWSLEREMAEVALLESSLVIPSQRVTSRRPRNVWLVAQHESFVVFYDEAVDTFGLGGLELDGRINDYEVYGDVVSCFIGR